ncbi:MAG: biopolymer transporter ExbD [Proteobacteria bacterium]|nr:biopolymer transporter ExbD [Pseudomonadota bacterium]
MEFERKKYNHTHINIAPLVDVVFLLLLFFMLSSNFIKEPVLKLKLPESKTSQNIKEDLKDIYITKEGRVYFMGGEVSINKLKEAILLNQNNENDFIRIKADKEADVGILISVIDEVRLAGIKNYSIATERR